MTWEPWFEVVGAAPVHGMPVPTLQFALAAHDPSGRRVRTLEVETSVRVELEWRSRRSWRADGVAMAPWPQPFVISQQQGATLGSFRGTTRFTLRRAIVSERDLAAGAYAAAGGHSDLPLGFYLRGTTCYEPGRGIPGAPQPWQATAVYRLPLAVWQSALEAARLAAHGRLLVQALERLAHRRLERSPGAGPLGTPGVAVRRNGFGPALESAQIPRGLQTS